jgi:hypothetical protein
MNKTLNIAALVATMIVTSSCSRSVNGFEQFIPPSRKVAIQLDSARGDQLQMLYVTCGMIVLQKGNEAVFFDPFFSYQPLVKSLFGIRSSQEDFRKFDQLLDTTINKGAVKAGFISHTHYDHLMDLPAIIQKKTFPNLADVYGSGYFQDIMHHHKAAGPRLQSLSDSVVYNPVSADTAFSYISISDSISVLPIASMHAPHKFGITLMNGRLKRKYFSREKFSDPWVKCNMLRWVTGCTYSFMVKFRNADGSDFKVFVQTSASDEPYGLPPRGEEADVAVLCFASMQEVNDHPNYIMRRTKAKKLILVHWEDFFRRPKHVDDIRMVRSTNKKLAKRRLREVQQTAQHPEIVMPKPGSLIRISY